MSEFVCYIATLNVFLVESLAETCFCHDGLNRGLNIWWQKLAQHELTGLLHCLVHSPALALAESTETPAVDEIVAFSHVRPAAPH